MFSKGLLAGDFFKSLAKKPAVNFDNLLAHAGKYVNREEAQRLKRSEIERKTREKIKDLAKEPSQSIERSSHLLLSKRRNIPH